MLKILIFSLLPEHLLSLIYIHITITIILHLCQEGSESSNYPSSQNNCPNVAPLLQSYGTGWNSYFLFLCKFVGVAESICLFLCVKGVALLLKDEFKLFFLIVPYTTILGGVLIKSFEEVFVDFCLFIAFDDLFIIDFICEAYMFNKMIFLYIPTYFVLSARNFKYSLSLKFDEYDSINEASKI